jgi:hypothetical protein
LLKENDLKQYVEVVVVDPRGPHELVVHKNKEVKAKRELLELVNDHLILCISMKKYSKEMYDSFVNIKKNKNTCMFLHLKHQLQVVRMSSEDMVVSYIMKITQIQDHLVVVSKMIYDHKLVNVSLRGLPNPWEPFLQGIFS